MKFELVQRLTTLLPNGQINPFGSDPWVAQTLLRAGAGVDLDCMGSANFQMGDMRESGGRIVAAANSLCIVTHTLARPSYKEAVHFMCTPEQESQGLLDEWHAWTMDPHPKEPTGFFRDILEDKVGVNVKAVIGWWALGEDEDLIWTRDYGVADNVRQAFVMLANG